MPELCHRMRTFLYFGHLLLPYLKHDSRRCCNLFFFLLNFLKFSNVEPSANEPPSQQTSNSTSTLRARLLQLSKKNQTVDRGGEEDEEIKAFLFKVATTHT